VAGQYLVVWAHGTAPTNHDIYSRLVDPDGTIPPGAIYGIAIDPDGDALSPAIGADPVDGDYLAVWSSDRGGTFDIKARRLKSDGTADGNIFSVSQSTGDERTPDVAFHPTNGKAMTVWLYKSGSTYNVDGRVVRADNSLDTGFRTTTTASILTTPSVSCHKQGEYFLVTWIASSYQVWGEWIKQDTSEMLLPFVLSNQASQKFTSDVAYGKDRFLAVWDDSRNTALEVYGQLGVFDRVMLPAIRK
jgi:hypothetical protein